MLTARRELEQPSAAGVAAPLRRLRVMQVLHQGGGAGSVTSTLHLSLGLAREGVHVRFVCPPGSEVERLARDGGLEVHPLQLQPRRTGANARALADLIRRAPVDIVNSQSSRDRGALTRLALLRRLPARLVVTRRQMPLTFFVENWLVARAADRVVAVSGAVADALARRGTPRRRITVIHNGVVTARLDRQVRESEVARWRERIGWEPTRATIGIVSRRKDQHVVVEALSAVATPVRLVLAGIDPEALRMGRGGDAPLAAAVARVPERHAVVCIPFDSDVRPLYELLDAALLPSRMEGLSQSLLEAMALGLPVAASDATSNREVVSHRRDGLLVPPLDPAAWAAAIDALLTDSGLAESLRAEARRTARERFSLDRTVERTLALYRDLAG